MPILDAWSGLLRRKSGRHKADGKRLAAQLAGYMYRKRHMAMPIVSDLHRTNELSRPVVPNHLRAPYLRVSSSRAVPETRMELPGTPVNSAVRRERMPMSSPWTTSILPPPSIPGQPR